MPPRVNRRRGWLFVCVIGMLLAALPAPASAQAPGLRGGVSVDPDQVFLGVHLETAPVVDRLHFRPTLEAGFGDDLTLIAFNIEFVYKFPPRRQWTLYAGGGPAVNLYSFDTPRRDETDAEPGFNVVFGAETSRGLLFEIKVGAIDSPDVKFAVGWTFR